MFGCFGGCLKRHVQPFRVGELVIDPDTFVTCMYLLKYAEEIIAGG